MHAELVHAEALTGSSARARTRSWLGQLAGLLLLIATIHYVEPSALLARLSRLKTGFIAFGASLVVPQLYCLALRWRLTAAQLGVAMPQRHALREYSLSMLLNLLLPFGIAGDALRMLRLAPNARPGRGEQQGRSSGIARAFQSVVLERMLGQVVVIVWAGAALPLWFGRTGVWLSVTLLAGLALLGLLIQRMSLASPAPRARPVRALLELALALRRLLASQRYLSAQLALSSAITLSIAAQLYCALGALGLSLSAAQASQVFPPMLLSMSLPLAFAGFGPREAVTAELYKILHLSAADGAAFALAFGAILICTTVPCLLLVLLLSEGDEP